MSKPSLCNISDTKSPLSHGEEQRMDPLNATAATHCMRLQSHIRLDSIDYDGPDNFDTTDNDPEVDSIGTLLADEPDLDEITDFPADPQANGSDRDGADHSPQDREYVKLEGLDWDDLPERMPNWIMAAFMNKKWRLAINSNGEIEIEVLNGRNHLVAWLTDILTNEESREEALLRAPIGGDGKEVVADEASRLMNAHQNATRARNTILSAGAGLVDEREE